jgi:hypothetical protein
MGSIEFWYGATISPPNTAFRTISGITLALPQGTLAPARSAGECNGLDSGHAPRSLAFFWL